ncbi:MAG: hypothetical protein KER_00360 [Kerstersia gyiorum]|uniref:DUF3772 domain-containing protein n=1 Tax=Kerstersia gyiorum TaxID=206506 RepID=UPI0030CB5B66
MHRLRFPVSQGLRPVLFLLLCLALWLGSGLPPAAAARPAPTPDFPWSTQLADARSRIDNIKAQVQETPEDEHLQALRLEALQAYRQASDAIQEITPTLANLQERQRELGNAPDGATEAAVLAEERKRLDNEAGSLEAQARLANLIALDATQALESIGAQRRELFNARLGQRSYTVLSGAFWSDLASTTPLDTMRSRGLLAETGSTLAGLSVWQWAGAAAWLVFMLAAGSILQRRFWHYSATQVPPGRLRRAVHGWTRVFLAVAVPTLLLEGFSLGLSWASPPSAPARDFITGMIGTVGFCGYIIGLGQGLLMPRHSSWRLLSMQDETAQALRHLPFCAALFIGLTWLAENLAALASVRLSIIVLIHSFAGLALILVLGGVLKKLSQLQRNMPDGKALSEAPWLTRLIVRRRGLVLAAAWLALVFSLGSLLVGYVALATFILKQIIWSSVVLGTAFLVSITATDLSQLPLWQRTGPQEDDDAGNRGDTPLRPWMVLLAGIVQMSIALCALLLLFAPYGQGPLDIYEHLERLRGSLSIGDIHLRPAAIIQGLLLLLLGVAAVKAMQHWLAHHLLPATRMERGMQASTSTLAGYLGYVVVVATALSASGVGLERVTWIASALSVGIGFGLQAIVQNFVSGLILLTERPVKVGDWVSLSGVEGDIRRINVRATEIQMSDRSRIVVPNSEFITKIVRNVTPLNALGRVQIKLPLPVDTDTTKARAILLEALAQEPAILKTPAPEVYLDDISSSSLLFNAVAYVSSPRAAYAARSRVLFDSLRRLREAGIAMSSPSTMLLAPAGIMPGTQQPPSQPAPPAQP